MSTTFVVVTSVTAIANAMAAGVDWLRPQWLVGNMTKYRVPQPWLPWLAVVKVAGAVGLLLGIAVPPIGVAAALGLFLYFVVAVIVVARSRWYPHIPFPAAFLLLAAIALAFNLVELFTFVP